VLTQDFDLEPVVSKFNYYFPGDGTNDNQACSQLVFLPLTKTFGELNSCELGVFRS